MEPYKFNYYVYKAGSDEPVAAFDSVEDANKFVKGALPYQLRVLCLSPLNWE